MERIFTMQEDQDKYEVILNSVNNRDRALASLLMAAGFHNDSSVEHERGLGPLYLIQAYHLNRNMKANLESLFL